MKRESVGAAAAGWRVESSQAAVSQQTETDIKEDSGEKSFWSKANLFVYYIFA